MGQVDGRVTSGNTATQTQQGEKTLHSATYRPALRKTQPARKLAYDFLAMRKT